jgi:hypothetical protein
LKDAVNEEKLGFNLAASIARSKKLHDEQGGLFANKLFHIVGHSRLFVVFGSLIYASRQVELSLISTR